MEIGDKIRELSSDLNIPIYYIKRPQGATNCIIYTYTEIPTLTGDMLELGTRYTILFNVYCKSDIEKTRKNVKQVLEQHGFKKKIILGTILEENDIYNTAMQYTISLKSNQD
ncbi:conserved hypothetical protein [Clostridium neonatale]|uniref:hypothetical protein n=1 Tax=Clostridium neonatale TaxID=137838 RepID=UPI001D44D812|nr:hypothetical protein [Clostridium neonatale]CAG9702597.1 conserved hypothetical protein [Clostridium neonatale]